MDLDREISVIAARARKAARALAPKGRAEKDAALRAIASVVRAERRSLVQENARDVEEARARGTSDAMIDRLALNDARIEAIARSLEEIAELDDPVGTIIESRVRPNGLRITRVRVPIGVIAMIYESRPNVTVE